MTGDENSAATRLATLLHAAAGSGWSTATLRITASGGATCFKAFTNTDPWLSFDARNSLPLLGDVARHVPGLGDTSAYSLELVLDSTGAFELTTGGVEAGSPDRVVLDPAYRLPNHPLPGMDFPQGARKTEEPTDPAVVAEVSALIHEFIERYSAIVGEPPKLESGYSEAEIVAAERDLGFRLPEDLRALYRTVRGDVAETGLLCRYSPYPLDRLVSTYQEGDPGSLGWDDGPFDAGVVFDTDPPGLVKRLSRGDWWITFAPDYAGNFLMIDLDPTGAGHVGQVMEAGRDFHGPVRYVSTSVTAMLTQVVEALRAGRYEHEAGYLQATTEFDSNNAGARYSKSFSQIHGRDLAIEVASLPDPDQKQEVILHDVVDLDLSALAPLRNVRAIRVNRAGSVALRVGGMPSLESLSVSAGKVDLESLAGHPTLWTIDLAGVEGPVDIGALATLPALCRLDLSRVELADVTQVTRLAGLRVLTLNKAQWRELRDAGSELPSLAAAEIGGPCSLDESAEWVAWLSDSRPRIHKTVGRV